MDERILKLDQGSRARASRQALKGQFRSLAPAWRMYGEDRKAKHGITFESWLFHQIEFYLYVNKKTVKRNETFLNGLITYKQLRILCEDENLFVPTKSLMRYYRSNNWQSGKDYIELKKSVRSHYLYHEIRIMKFLRYQQIKRNKQETRTGKRTNRATEIHSGKIQWLTHLVYIPVRKYSNALYYSHS